MSFKKIVISAVLIASAAVSAFAEGQKEGASGSFPSRSLEFVACYGPGGGHDTMLRTMQKILAEDGIITDTVNVVNKPGGSGTIGMAYVNGHAGDGHYLMSATSSFLATPLNTGSSVTYKDFTPIARLGVDPNVIVVNSKSEFKTLDDAIHSGRLINIGGNQGSIDHILAKKLEEMTDIQFNFVPFQGDGELVSGLLGGQIDMIATNPNTALDYIKSGDFRALAISIDERLPALPDVPTLQELGYDITLSVFRGIVAPKDISEEAKAYYSKMAKELSEDERWQKEYLERNTIAPGYLNSEDFGAYLEDLNGEYKDILTSLGIIK